MAQVFKHVFPYQVEITEFTIEKCLQGWCSNVKIWSTECLVDLWYHIGQATEDPPVQFTEVISGTVQVRIQSSGKSFEAHSSVFAGLPYLVAEQSVCLALLHIKTDKMTWNDIQDKQKQADPTTLHAWQLWNGCTHDEGTTQQQGRNHLDETGCTLRS